MGSLNLGWNSAAYTREQHDWLARTHAHRCTCEAVYHRRLGDIFFRLHRDHHLVTTYKMPRFSTSAPGSQVSHHLSDLLQLFTPLLPSFLS